MNYQNSELQDRLAAEYVIGTLHGRARARFERLLRQDHRLQQAVHQWEERLTPLTESLPPEAPPARVWRSIEQRISPAPTRSSLWERLSFWRGLTLAGFASALVLGVALIMLPRVEDTAPAAMAVFADDGQTLWVLAAQPERDALEVRAVNPPNVAANQDLELWLLPPGGAPKSLGLLPREGSRLLPLPDISQGGLAVSLEPAGGSPTGLPTGPVLYQAPILRL